MPPKKRARTALAEIYGHPRSDLPVASVLKTTVPLKSGLTPLEPGPFSTRLELLDFLHLKICQKRRFRGFSAAQLHANDALASTDTRSQEALASLPGVAIHPLISKNKWRKLPKHLAK